MVSDIHISEITLFSFSLAYRTFPHISGYFTSISSSVYSNELTLYPHSKPWVHYLIFPWPKFYPNHVAAITFAQTSSDKPLLQLYPTLVTFLPGISLWLCHGGWLQKPRVFMQQHLTNGGWEPVDKCSPLQGQTVLRFIQHDSPGPGGTEPQLPIAVTNLITNCLLASCPSLFNRYCH